MGLLASGRERRFEAAGEEQVDPLGRVARHREDFAERDHLARTHPRLLGEFPVSALERRLARVERPRRDLPQEAVRRVPELPEELRTQQAWVVKIAR